MTPEKLNLIYNNAKKVVIKNGFQSDIDWQNSRVFENITAQNFFTDLAFVILNSGMKASVIAGIWPSVKIAFFEFDENSLRQTPLDYCFNAAFAHFKNEKKLKAIMTGIKIVQCESWETIRHEIKMYGVDYLERFPFIGPITKYHLAKNIGFDVAKPDRHLERMALASGFDGDVQRFCKEISNISGDKVPTVDIVLWRWATIYPEYLEALQNDA